MRNKQHLIKEIVELCVVKSAYIGYLSLHTSQFEVENAAQVQQNLKTISATLRGLYTALEDLNNKRQEDERHEITDERQAGNKTANFLKTMNAIMLFNTDTRFTITE